MLQFNSKQYVFDPFLSRGPGNLFNYNLRKTCLDSTLNSIRKKVERLELERKIEFGPRNNFSTLIETNSNCCKNFGPITVAVSMTSYVLLTYICNAISSKYFSINKSK